MGSDSSVSLSESKFDYGVDGHTFEPIRSDDTAGHVSHADDGTGYEEVVVVVARRSFHKKRLRYTLRTSSSSWRNTTNAIVCQ